MPLTCLAFVGATILGVTAKSADADAKDACPRNSCTPQDALEANNLRDKANRRALGANIAIGVGVGAAIGAGVLWFLGAPGPVDARLTTGIADGWGHDGVERAVAGRTSARDQGRRVH